MYLPDSGNIGHHRRSVEQSTIGRFVDKLRGYPVFDIIGQNVVANVKRGICLGSAPTSTYIADISAHLLFSEPEDYSPKA